MQPDSETNRWGGKVKKHLTRLAKISVCLSLALCAVSVCYAQTAGRNPDDYAYDLGQRLHDANGNYCAKPLTVQEARFLTQYYGAHKNDPPGENSVILSNTELEVAKSMAKGKCAEPVAAPTGSAGSNTANPRVLAKSLQAPAHAVSTGAAELTPTPASRGKSEKAHVIRIGVASPDAQIGQGGPMGSVAEPIRMMMIQYLNGPGLEIVPMTAMLPMQIEAEAKEKACDYVLYSSVTQKKSGMSFLKAATMASSLTPIGAMAGATRAATAAAGTAAAAQAATVSSAVKAKTEYSLTYKLLSAGNPTPVLTNSASAKAKSDGEDVMTPLIQQAATAILAQVQTKK
jgi:hypothetical protein